MPTDFLKWIFRFLLLIGFQILILDGVEFSSYFYPMVYVFFILMLPLKMGTAFLMTIAFITGFTIDLFSDTAGMHASACLVLAAFRPFVIRIIEPPTSYDDIDIPGIYTPGLTWFLTYTIMLVTVHHLVYFIWEIYSFRFTGYIIGKTLLSSAFSVLLITILSFLIFSKEKRR